MSNLDLFRRRLGKFKLSVDVIEQSPNDILNILSTVIPIKAEYLYEDNCIHYTALSYRFEPLQTGRIPSWYLPTLILGDNVIWKQIDE